MVYDKAEDDEIGLQHPLQTVEGLQTKEREADLRGLGFQEN